MKIEIWFDFICPFCNLGMTKFEKALNDFEHKDEVEISYRSFQLKMASEDTKGKHINQIIAERYNISYEQAKQNNDNVIRAASAAGLNYNFDILIINSTEFAHKLAIFAKQSGKDRELIKLLSKGHFEEGLDIGNESDLTNIAKEIGLDTDNFQKQLLDGSLDKQIKNDEFTANQLGISSIPFFVIDDKYGISGAREPEDFLNALRQAYNESTQ